MGKKEAHELFVQNLKGSTSEDVLCVVLNIALFTLLDGLTRLLFGLHEKSGKTIVKFVVDLLVIALPMMAIITTFSESLPVVFATSLFGAGGITMIILSFSGLRGREKLSAAVNSNEHVKETSSSTMNQSKVELPQLSLERVVVSEYRGTIVLFATMTILAVDFHVFPRWMAKTEVAGYSVMDMGVGAFCIANALVASQAKEQRRSSFSTLWKEIKETAVLVVLGCGRFVAVALTDYQAPEAEYGRHWNFFCTLAVVKVFGRISAMIVTPRYLPLLGVSLLTVYEAILQRGWQEFVLDSPTVADQGIHLIRDNLSGLSSCLGFLALFLIWVHFAREFQKCRKFDDLLAFGLQLGLGSFALTITIQFLPLASRRLANAGYVLWTTHLALAFLSVLIIFRIFLASIDQYLRMQYRNSTPSSQPIVKSFGNFFRSLLTGTCRLDSPASLSPDLLSAVNYNAMGVFLLANVATGLINLTADTTQCSERASLAVLFSYVTAISVVATTLHQFSLKIPLRLPDFSKKPTVTDSKEK